MFKLNNHGANPGSNAHLAWLLPVLVLSPLALAAKGCNNSGTVGDDCPATAACAISAGGDGASGSTGNAGKPSTGAGGSSASGGSTGAAGAGTGTGTAGTPGTGTGTAGTPGTGGGGSGKSCGGLQGLTCSANEYCLFANDAQCGAADQTGTCAPKTTGCLANYDPVCGCDGNTYGNACEAAHAGSSVSSVGACPVTCGTRGAPVTCAAGQYCYYAPGANCGRSDAAGKCTDIPKNAACDAVFAPVCGCDGMTYSNDCVATLAGASVDHTGACATNGSGTCGGLLGKTCSAGYFCDYPADMACGNADGTGSCTQIPQACTDNIAPVCGCDGKTYSNACVANAKGVSVMSTGACK